jgi:hypothetical protein
VIERYFVEVRRRTRPMVVFTNVDNVDRISVPAGVLRANDSASAAILRGAYTGTLIALIGLIAPRGINACGVRCNRRMPARRGSG